MKKIFVSIVLVLCVILLSACGTGNDPYVEQELLLIRNAKTGDIITFGTYEQDNIPDNGLEPIEWEVLNIQDGKALLISKYALDCQPYNEEDAKVTWETCTLRKWLNREFLKTAFSSAEAAVIAKTTLVNNDNSLYETKGGNDTQDKIFLLSLDEGYQANIDLICRLTNYGKEQIINNYAEFYGVSREESEEWCRSQEDKYGQNSCWWWLRSPGYVGNIAAFAIRTAGIPNAAAVDHNGHVSDMGYSVNLSFGAVRPALWIDLGS